MRIPRSRTALTALALALTTALGACGGDDDPTEPENQVVVIELTNYQFSDADVTISPGTTVRWVNRTSTFHTVTPDGHSEWTEWTTDTEGQSFEHTFDTAGTYDYICVPHESLGMVGVIRVQ